MGLCCCLIQANQHEVLKADQNNPTAGTEITYDPPGLTTTVGGNTHHARLAVRPIMEDSEYSVPKTYIKYGVMYMYMVNCKAML